MAIAVPIPKSPRKKPYTLLAHAKFRAAYDFLLLRAQINDASIDLCDWWTKFQ